MSRRIAFAGILAFAAACGGSSNEVNGSYHGQSIDVADALLLPPQKDVNGNAVTVAVLESESDACTLLQSRFINNTRFVTVAVAIQRPDGLLDAGNVTGTYQIGGTFRQAGAKIAGVQFDIVGACGGGTIANAVSGTVNVTRADADASGTVQHLEGTFDATFDGGDKLSGSFQVSMCGSARIQFGVCV